MLFIKLFNIKQTVKLKKKKTVQLKAETSKTLEH